MLSEFFGESSVIVVDIETLGKKQNAVIASVASALVDLRELRIKATYFSRVSLECRENALRSRCTDTLEFWNKQTQAAKDLTFSTIQAKPLPEVLTILGLFIGNASERPQVFGNGPEFDNAILVDAFEQCGISQEWDYGSNQSLRTAVMMGRTLLNIDPKSEIPFKGVKHHALDDVVHESEVLIAIVKAFRERLK